MSRAEMAGRSIEWYTPPEVFEALGLEFDLDVASPSGGLPWVPAKRCFSIYDDGLSQPWEGRIWMNPPYGRGVVEHWLRRLAEHGNGLALIFNRSDSRWWQEIFPRATSVCFIYRRLRFIRPNGSKGWDAPAPCMLMAFGLECSLALAASGLGITFAVPQGLQTGAAPSGIAGWSS